MKYIMNIAKDLWNCILKVNIMDVSTILFGGNL